MLPAAAAGLRAACPSLPRTRSGGPRAGGRLAVAPAVAAGADRVPERKARGPAARLRSGVGGPVRAEEARRHLAVKRERVLAPVEARDRAPAPQRGEAAALDRPPGQRERRCRVTQRMARSSPATCGWPPSVPNPEPNQSVPRSACAIQSRTGASAASSEPDFQSPSAVHVAAPSPATRSPVAPASLACPWVGAEGLGLRRQSSHRRPTTAVARPREHPPACPPRRGAASLAPPPHRAPAPSPCARSARATPSEWRRCSRWCPVPSAIVDGRARARSRARASSSRCPRHGNRPAPGTSTTSCSVSPGANTRVRVTAS